MTYTHPSTHPTATAPLGMRDGEEKTGLEHRNTHLTTAVSWKEQCNIRVPIVGMNGVLALPDSLQLLCLAVLHSIASLCCCLYMEKHSRHLHQRVMCARPLFSVG